MIDPHFQISELNTLFGRKKNGKYWLLGKKSKNISTMFDPAPLTTLRLLPRDKSSMSPVGETHYVVLPLWTE